MSKRCTTALYWLLLLGILANTTTAQTVKSEDKQLQKINVEERLGAKIPLDLTFFNEAGVTVQLKDYFTPEKPVLLTLAYYECPMLCTLVLNGLNQAVRELEWQPGDKFQMVTVSIDPGETPELAMKKKQAYVSGYDPDLVKTGWAFLVGDQESITQLAEAVGFQYFYDAKRDEYAHPAVSIVLSSDGSISRYLYGIDQTPRDLKLALLEASQGKIGNTLDRFILYCYAYDPQSESYTLFASNLMRIGGIITVILLGGMLGFFWYREYRQQQNRSIKPDAGDS